jgi:hypothetical protein
MAAIRFCEVCKMEIDAERADALPETRLCGQHAREIQQYGGEFLLRSRQERTSKQGSLKHNYGGVTASFRPNVEGLERLRRDYETRA